MNIYRLPGDIIFYICDWLTVPIGMRFLRTCKTFYQLRPRIIKSIEDGATERFGSERKLPYIKYLIKRGIFLKAQKPALNTMDYLKLAVTSNHSEVFTKLLKKCVRYDCMRIFRLIAVYALSLATVSIDYSDMMDYVINNSTKYSRRIIMMLGNIAKDEDFEELMYGCRDNGELATAVDLGLSDKIPISPGDILTYLEQLIEDDALGDLQYHEDALNLALKYQDADLVEHIVNTYNYEKDAEITALLDTRERDELEMENLVQEHVNRKRARCENNSSLAERLGEQLGHQYRRLENTITGGPRRSSRLATKSLRDALRKQPIRPI